MAVVHQRACGPLSHPSTRKRKEKGFQSKRPSKMGPCAGHLGRCHCGRGAEERCVGNGAGGRTAGGPLPQSRLGVAWGFCPYEGLNVSLCGAMPLWFPRLAFQTPVCASVCVHVCERYAHVRVYTPTVAHSSICIHAGPLYSLQSKLDLNDSLETK